MSKLLNMVAGVPQRLGSGNMFSIVYQSGTAKFDVEFFKGNLALSDSTENVGVGFKVKPYSQHEHNGEGQRIAFDYCTIVTTETQTVEVNVFHGDAEQLSSSVTLSGSLVVASMPDSVISSMPDTVVSSLPDIAGTVAVSSMPSVDANALTKADETFVFTKRIDGPNYTWMTLHNPVASGVLVIVDAVEVNHWAGNWQHGYVCKVPSGVSSDSYELGESKLTGSASLAQCHYKNISPSPDTSPYPLSHTVVHSCAFGGWISPMMYQPENKIILREGEGLAVTGASTSEMMFNFDWVEETI